MKKQPMSSRERRVRFFGKWIITPFFAVGSGILTAVAASSLGVIAAPLIPVLAAIFLAETAVAIYLFRNSVPDTLVALFLNNIFKGSVRDKKLFWV